MTPMADHKVHDPQTRQTIVRLLSSMAGAKEISQYLKRFSQLDAARFALVKVGGAVLRDDLDALTSSLAFLQDVGLTPIVIHGAGPQLDEALSTAGIDKQIVNGLRVTTPEALAYRSRQEFEQETRNFLRDAPKLDDNTRNTRALALSREINRREQNREFSAGEAVMLRIGLIHAAVKDESERVRQAQTLIARYREQNVQRERAFQAQQRSDAQFQQYKAQEARIVSEVLAMQYYPDGMSRDDYLRQRLQETRKVIYGGQAQTPPGPNAATGKP